MTGLRYIAPGPVADAFLWDDHFVSGIRGPVGSGKSTACVMRILRHAQEQRPGPDGRRKSRWAVIRNTFPELRTTTIKTWHEWVPQARGYWRETGPPSHHIRDGDLDLEVLFLALDKPEDIRKILSLEVTGVWLNEAREIPKAILDAATGRAGRYPSAKDGGASWYGVIMDTNPCDTDHWWYTLAEDDRPEDFAFFAQPSGLSDDAENIENLPGGYYPRLMGGKREEWIKVYVRGEYGYVQDGKPVYPEYVDSLHCQPFELERRLPISLGIDFGLTPACLIGQRMPMGQVRWRHEIVTERMGARALGEEIGRYLGSRLRDFEVAEITGDPAGNAGSSTDESETPFTILRAAGIAARPAETNDFELRREAVAAPLSRIIDGKPGLIIHPECRVTRKGMMGGYRFKRVQVAGHEQRYQDKPDKNSFSHPCEAGQYHNLGLGEGKAVLRRSPSQQRRPFVAQIGRIM